MKLVFLIYFPRSGSTMVAHRLSQLDNRVLILPEFRTASYLFLLGSETVRNLSPRELKRQFDRDDQIGNLNIPDDKMDLIATEMAGCAIGAIIDRLCCEAAAARDVQPETVVVKNGLLAYYWKEVLAEFPNADFLHVYRDPRGALSSMLKTPTLDGASTMGRGDVISDAKRWQNVILSVSELKQRFPDRVAEIKYEDALFATDIEVARQLPWLDFEAATSPDKSLSHRFVVPESERSLHKLVGEPARTDRAIAWQGCLALRQGVAIEFYTQRGRMLLGYSDYFLNSLNAFGRVVNLLLETSVHWFRKVEGSLRRLGKAGRLIGKDPRLLWIKYNEIRKRYSR